MKVRERTLQLETGSAGWVCRISAWLPTKQVWGAKLRRHLAPFLGKQGLKSHKSGDAGPFCGPGLN